MKLNILLLKRAVANKDADIILRVFSEHYPELVSFKMKHWRFQQEKYIPADSMRLESPFGSYHYYHGLFRMGGYVSPWKIVYHPNFISDAVL